MLSHFAPPEEASFANEELSGSLEKGRVDELKGKPSSVQFCTADKLSIRYGPQARPFGPLFPRLEALTQNMGFYSRLYADFGLNARERSGLVALRSTPPRCSDDA